MKKYLMMIPLAAVGSLLFAVGPAQASTDACFDRATPPAKASCVASATEDKVTFASVRVNRIGKARWRLSCEKGSHEYVASGRVRGSVNRLRVIALPTEQFFQNPECRLSAVARGTRLKTNRGFVKAKVRVTLLSG